MSSVAQSRAVMTGAKKATKNSKRSQPAVLFSNPAEQSDLHRKSLARLCKFCTRNSQRLLALILVGTHQKCLLAKLRILAIRQKQFLQITQKVKPTYRGAHAVQVTLDQALALGSVQSTGNRAHGQSGALRKLA